MIITPSIYSSLLLTLTPVFFSLLSFAQSKVINKDLVKPDTNLLYAFVPNRLALVNKPVLKNITVVSSSNAEIAMGISEITVKPRIKVGFDTLRFYKGKAEMFSKIYCVVPIGDMKTQLAFTSDTVLYKSTIVANPFLRVAIPNSYYKIYSHIYGFTCLIYPKNNQVVQFKNVGSKLSPKLIASIQSLSPGDRLIFENIKVGFRTSYCPRTMMETLTIVIR